MKKVVLGITLMLSALGMTAVARTSSQNNGNVCNTTQQTVCNGQKCATQQVCKGDSVAIGKCKAHRHEGKKKHHGNKGAIVNDSVCLRKGNCQPTVARYNPRHERIDRSFRHDKTGSALFNGIELNADQKSKLQALDRKIAGERRAEAKKMKEEARSAYNKGVKDILTADQYAKFELNRKAMQAKKAEKQEARKLKSDARKLKAEARKAQTTATGTTANQ